MVYFIVYPSDGIIAKAHLLFKKQFLEAKTTTMSGESSDDTKATPAPKESWNERINRFFATGHSHLHASVASAVDGINSGLAAVEETTKNKIGAPVKKIWHTATEAEHKVETQMDYLYKHRYEYGPAAVGGTAVAAAAVTKLRGRGLPRTALMATLAGGLAYVAVYEPIPVRQIPEMIKNQLQPKEKK